LAAGIALRDCVIIAAAAPLALRAFYIGMDANAPMDAVRAAIRGALAGVASLMVAGALALMTLAAIHGIWQPTHDRFFAGPLLLGASILAFGLSTREEGAAATALSPWLIASAALTAGIAGTLAAQGFRWDLCALPLATALLMALAGWRLLHEVASAFLGISRVR
jgi:hypothetical protein